MLQNHHLSLSPGQVRRRRCRIVNPWLRHTPLALATLAALVAGQLVAAGQDLITLVNVDDQTLWSYDRSGADLGTPWKEKGFDDSAWPKGAALLGDEGTTVAPMRSPISRYNDDGNYVTTMYFRTHFNFSGGSATRLLLTHIVDDGVVLYLNGVEVHRFGLAAGATFNYKSYFTDHENAYEGPFLIPVSPLVQGDNVLAAEVHQSGSSSSDIVFGALLQATTTNTPPTSVDLLNPAANAVDVPFDTAIEITLVDGTQKVQAGSIQLSVNGQAVVPTVSKPAGTFATKLSYLSPTTLPAGSLVTVSLVYSDDATPPNVTTNQYSFTTKSDLINLVAIDDKTPWRYNVSGSDLGTVWKEKNYDDGAWLQGPALLGEEGTTVEPLRTPIPRYNENGDFITTTYFRTHFNYTGPAGAQLRLKHVVDDGVVLYLNGAEVHRFGIAAGASFNAATLFSDHENKYEGPFTVPSGSLLKGDNVLAAEVHQAGVGSSDVVFGAVLDALTSNLPRTSIDTLSPAPDAVEVPRDATIQIALVDGTQTVEGSSIQLYVNGQAVTPTVAKPAGSFTTTVTYRPPTIFPRASLVLVKLVFSDGATPPNVTTREYSFTTTYESVPIFGIDDTTLWKYDRSGADLGAAWKEKSFNDSAWPEGAALLGEEGTTAAPMRSAFSRFNDNGDHVTTFYFRTHFNFAGNPANAILRLRHVIDDGAVFYLNGVEVYRFGLAADAPFNSQTLFADHENAWEGPFTLPASNLVVGDNVMAVEVHQNATDSSDIVFGAELASALPTPQPLKISIARSGADLVISWTQTGTLQSADTPAGPWSDVSGATNPTILTSPPGSKFYRIKQ